jgi:hypothetical protein
MPDRSIQRRGEEDQEGEEDFDQRWQGGTSRRAWVETRALAAQG